MRPVSPSEPTSRHASDGPAAPGGGGFTLVEILVALALTALILTMAGQIVMSMKRSADRMRLKAETHELAQKAADYVAYHLRAASDMNRPPGTGTNNPAAVITWYLRNGANVQASYNNVTNANLADVNTDIITVAMPTASTRASYDASSGSFPGVASSTAASWAFGLGCPSDTDNLNLFKSLTGFDGTGGGPVLLVDSTGGYAYYQITAYGASSCSSTPPTVSVTANPAAATLITPMPGELALNAASLPLLLQVSIHFYSFRVRNGWLEQKEGLFDPATDNPGTAFVPILPQIEDLQLAWVFADGTVWNTPVQQLNAATYPGSIPSQGTSANPYDVANVHGFRVGVCARSVSALTWDSEANFKRPELEDHAAATASDQFFHEAVSTLAMVRNRNLQQ